jgi:hypothetical protein
MCYGFINTACALQTLLKSPSWRPRFKYYHWTLSLLGLFLCLAIMFIVKWYYAIVAIILAGFIYKYIEFKGAEKEWGDGIRGLSMSAARFALLRLEDSPPHVKNWRPQILLLIKCNRIDNKPDTNNSSNNVNITDSVEVVHPNSFAFASQLKAGQGLFVCANVTAGDFMENYTYAKECKKVLKAKMNQYKAKGFCDTIVSETVEQGICHLIQTEGLGGLRHNTIILNWSEKWNKENIYNKMDEEEENSISFVQILRYANANESALILTKGIDSWPTNSRSESQSGPIDLWWIIHDGGLLLLIVFLLKKHKIWQKCKLRLFTVARVDENSVQIKNDLVQYMYFLRIEAEVEVVEMNESEISAYTYEKTLKLHERQQLMRDLKVKDKVAENEPQIKLETVRRGSISVSSKGPPLGLNSASNSVDNNDDQNVSGVEKTSATEKSNSSSQEKINSTNNQYTFSPTKPARRPSLFQTEAMRKMHSAVELNKKILEKSKDSCLVLMNIPAPPKSPGIADYNCKKN